MHIITRAHKIRLNPTADQAAYFMQASGIARFAWNWALDEYKRRKSADLKADWNDIKKEFRRRIGAEFPFVRDVTKCAFEEAISDLRRSISTYYKSKDKSSRVRFPSYRKRHKRIGGFGIANDKFEVDGNSVRIPKLGWVNMAEPLRFGGKIMSGRVVERTGRWYLVVTVEIEQPECTAEGSVGIDFGLKSFATLSNGTVYEIQKHYRKQQRKLRSLSRSLSRKVSGSANYAKQKLRVARCHERIANQRSDFLHKMTTEVSRKYGVVCVEDLNLKGLCRTRLAKSFSDAGIGSALRMLDYKAGVVQRVSRWFPSSKMCGSCGSLNDALTLSDRVWLCGCGAVNDRDLNAAHNIELEGVRLLAGSSYIGETPVEFAASAAALVPR